MKRFHLNLKVSDLQKSTEYYSALFCAQPSVAKDDYVKWMLDDPYINLSIEPAAGETGIAHVGIQAENADELAQVYARVAEAAGPVFDEGETTCCYSHSEKNWTRDPDGVIWEAFHTDGEAAEYGKPPEMQGIGPADSCCMPAPKTAQPIEKRCC